MKRIKFIIEHLSIPCITLLLVTLILNTDIYANSFWPLHDIKPLKTNWSVWNERFIGITKDNKIVSYSNLDQLPKATTLFTLKKKPDIIKHFPLESGDLIFTLDRDAKKFSFYGFDEAGKKTYYKSYSFAYTILSADVRIDNNGNPICLFYSRNEQNYIVSLWKKGSSTDIYYTRYYIDLVHLTWSPKRIDLLTYKRNTLQWFVWRDGQISTYNINSYLNNAHFFLWENHLYLLAINSKGQLERYFIDKGKINKVKLIKKSNFKYADDILTIVQKGQLNLIITSSRLKASYKIIVDSLLGGKIDKKVSALKLVWASDITPVLVKDKLFALYESELGHVYLQNWQAKRTGIFNLSWKVNTKKSPPELIIKWKTNKKKSKYSYSYIIDHKTGSLPLYEYKRLPKNKIVFYNPKDGYYGFHLQYKDDKNQKLSPVYHIPIYWKYRPETPEIGLVNEISSNLVPSGKLSFFIKNLDKVNYFAQVNSIPKYTPKKKIKSRTGKFTLKKKLKPGRYYLHIRSKDKRSKLSSYTLHSLFYVDPYNVDQDETLVESDRKLGDIDYIMKKIKQNSENPQELRKWIRKLRNLKPK